MVVLEDPVYRAPLYSQSEAARIIDVPVSTFRSWTSGYRYNPSGSRSVHGLIALADDHGRQRVSFLGLAEGYVIAALREAGIPMLRIRPAIDRLKSGMGLEFALVSERLKTDGMNVLFEFVGDEGANADGRVGLAVVDDKQLVFREVVEMSLRSVTYEDGVISSIPLRRYGDDQVVTVSPRLNGGQPSFRSSGVRVEDIVRRLQAGESFGALADDYDMDVHEIEAALRRD